MQGTDVRCHSKEFLTEVIELYKSLPCLWRTRRDEFYDRFTKEAAWLEMLNKFREVDSEITREGVIKKLNSMRTSWRKEAKKVKLYQDVTADEAGALKYYPKLWYFELLSFIDDQDPLGEGASTLTVVPVPTLQATTEDEVSIQGPSDLLVKVEELSTDFADPASPQFYGVYLDDNPPAAKIQKIQQPHTPESVADSQSGSPGGQPQPEQDCYDYFGRYVASMLRTIGAPDALMLQQEITVMITNRMCSTTPRPPSTA